MSVTDTVCALLATNIGAGILATPYALYHMGLIFGTFYIIFIGLVCLFTILMYVQTKQLMPRNVETVFEIAYLMFGRSSIFIVCGILLLDCLGCVILFYMMIGETFCGMVTRQVKALELEEVPLYLEVAMRRSPYILVAGFV